MNKDAQSSYIDLKAYGRSAMHHFNAAIIAKLVQDASIQVLSLSALVWLAAAMRVHRYSTNSKICIKTDTDAYAVSLAQTMQQSMITEASEFC
jgi:hypothetical protein